MKKWEYKVIYVNENASADRLETFAQSMGRDGWELVAVTLLADYKLFFKRRASDQTGTGRPRSA